MDIQPSDVRPLQVLQDTLFYLFRLLDSSEHPFELVHDFIFDRTRAIRQDISMQNITSVQAIHMYEEMVKFHIVSQYKLPRCSDDPNISLRTSTWNNSQNAYYHFMTCTMPVESPTPLTTMKPSSIHIMFFCISILKAKKCHYFDKLITITRSLNHDFNVQGESLSLWLRRLTTPVVKSKEMCFCSENVTSRFFRMGNYKCFFSTIAAEASYLHYCLMEPLIHEESDMESLCNSCGFEISSDEAGNKLLPLKQTGSCRTKTGFQKYTFMGSERIQRLVLGGDFGVMDMA
ncbi:hypothetical protein GIB67_021906 [Kingdonia uniflora]|uniref:SAC3/GANP/THP3 conserved domain-containing protein n=1 Tax=Kingdonia uniflora TaxID=39325 RepID=A0A7J7MVE2_9MAGN|nr:hypothetical protein GIB67_021906 [Kingdonia uniflora]